MVFVWIMALLIAVACIVAAVLYQQLINQSSTSKRTKQTNIATTKPSFNQPNNPQSLSNGHVQHVQQTPIKLADMMIPDQSTKNNNASNNQTVNELSIRSPQSSSTRSSRALPAPSPFLWTRPSTTIDSTINQSINQLIQATPRADGKRNHQSINQQPERSVDQDSSAAMELDNSSRKRSIDQSTDQPMNQSNKRAVISLSDALYSSYSANKSNKKSRNQSASFSNDEPNGMEIDVESINQSTTQSRKRKSNAAITPTHRKRPSSDNSENQRVIKRRTDQSNTPQMQQSTSQSLNQSNNQSNEMDSLDESMTEDSTEPTVNVNLDSYDSADLPVNQSTNQDDDRQVAESSNQPPINQAANQSVNQLVVKEPLLDESALENYQKRKSTRSQMNSRRSVNQSIHLFDNEDDESHNDPIDQHRHQQVQKLLEEGFAGNRRRVNQPIIEEKDDTKPAVEQSNNQLVSQTTNPLPAEQHAAFVATSSAPAPAAAEQSINQTLPEYTTPAASLFAAPSSSTTTGFNFGTTAPAAAAPVAQTASISPFSVAATASAPSTASVSLGGASSTGSSFNLGANSSTTPSAFGTTPAATSSPFGQPVVQPAQPGASAQPSPFGAPFGATPAATPLPFGQPIVQPAQPGASAQPSPFGAPAQSQQPSFGTPSQPQQPFGAPAQSQQPSFGITQPFGAPSTNAFGGSQPVAAPQQTNMFGGSTFGANPPAFGAAPSAFGSNTTSLQPTFGASPFGNAQPPAFGGAQNQQPQSGFGTFGASQQSTFGSAAPPAQQGFSGFGGPPAQPAAAPTAEGASHFKAAPRKPGRGGRRK